VVGGLVFSQVLTLYVTPVFFVSMESLSTFINTRLKKKVDGGVAHQVA
jgi:HAE1 family hydrophobic/amphiphilic exporter-1